MIIATRPIDQDLVIPILFRNVSNHNGVVMRVGLAALVLWKHDKRAIQATWHLIFCILMRMVPVRSCIWNHEVVGKGPTRWNGVLGDTGDPIFRVWQAYPMPVNAS